MAAAKEETQIWDRQRGETEASFTHFCFYRDMRYPVSGDGKPDQTGAKPFVQRSLRKTAAAFGLNLRTIASQSERNDWVKRCEAYDSHIDRENRKITEAAIIKMQQEHALLAQQMIRKATKRLLTIPDEEISAAELTRMVDVAVKIERLSRGESTENQTVTHGGEVGVKSEQALDLSSLSDEELDQFEQLIEKINGVTDE